MSVTSLSAGVVYTMETTELATEQPVTMNIAAQDKTMKMTFQDEVAGNRFLIFKSGEDLLLVGDPSDKTYIKMDEQTLQQIRTTMEQARQQMEQALAQAPEGQREQMRRMMEQQMPGMLDAAKEPPKVEVKKTGETQTIEGYETRSFDVMVDGEKQSTLWVTDWDNIEGSKDIQQTFISMADFFTRFLDSLPQTGDQSQESAAWMRALEEVGGFPVKSVDYADNGEVRSETVLKDVENKDLAASELTVPDGWREKSLGMGGPGMGR